MGEKFLHSKAFYGGIGAKIKEFFAVYEMEKDQTSFFVSTTPYNPKEPTMPVNQDYLQLLALYYPQEYAQYMAAPTHTITPEQLIKELNAQCGKGHEPSGCPHGQQSGPRDRP